MDVFNYLLLAKFCSIHCLFFLRDPTIRYPFKNNEKMTDSLTKEHDLQGSNFSNLKGVIDRSPSTASTQEKRDLICMSKI